MRIGFGEFDAVNLSDAVIAYEPVNRGLFKSLRVVKFTKNQLRDIYVTVARHASGISCGIRRRRRLRAIVFTSCIGRRAFRACIRRSNRRSHAIIPHFAPDLLASPCRIGRKRSGAAHLRKPLINVRTAVLSPHANSAVLPERVASVAPACQPTGDDLAFTAPSPLSLRESLTSSGANGARAPPSI